MSRPKHVSPPADLTQRLEQALRERDEALAQLAQARSYAEALRLKLEQRGEVPPPVYPKWDGQGDVPFRYAVADTVNEGLKKWLGPVHQLLRTTLDSSRDK